MMDDFDLVGALSFEPPADPPGVGRRQAFRAVPPGLTVRQEGTLDSFGVNDISAGGVCIAMPELRFEKGRLLRLDLLIAGRLFLKGMESLVVRAVPGECACAFQNLTRHQELKLDKLVLEVQKRDITRRRLEREAETASPDDASATAGGGKAGPGAETSSGEGLPAGREDDALPPIHLPL